MSEPTKENIATVTDGLENFFEHMIKTQSFNLEEFVNFMEPRFETAGYREELKYNVNGNYGGGTIY